MKTFLLQIKLTSQTTIYKHLQKEIMHIILLEESSRVSISNTTENSAEAGCLL